MVSLVIAEVEHSGAMHLVTFGCSESLLDASADAELAELGEGDISDMESSMTLLQSFVAVHESIDESAAKLSDPEQNLTMADAAFSEQPMVNTSHRDQTSAAADASTALYSLKHHLATNNGSLSQQAVVGLDRHNVTAGHVSRGASTNVSDAWGKWAKSTIRQANTSLHESFLTARERLLEVVVLSLVVVFLIMWTMRPVPKVVIDREAILQQVYQQAEERLHDLEKQQGREHIRKALDDCQLVDVPPNASKNASHEQSDPPNSNA